MLGLEHYARERSSGFTRASLCQSQITWIIFAFFLKSRPRSGHTSDDHVYDDSPFMHMVIVSSRSTSYPFRFTIVALRQRFPRKLHSNESSMNFS